MEEKKEEISKKEEKQKRIKKEMQKIKRLYKNLSKTKLEQIAELIYRAAFLLVMAQDMEYELLQYDKYTTTTVNASQQFLKANPLLKDYRDTVKSYQAVLKQLDDLTKDNLNESPKSDELDEWLDK